MFMSCIFLTCREEVILPTASIFGIFFAPGTKLWMGPGSRERRIATIKAFCRWSWKWRPQRAHWTIDYRASIGLYWYFNSNVSATHTHIITYAQPHNHTFEYIYILVVFYIHYIIIQYIIICLKALKLYIYICAQSILCACLKLFVCMSCSTLYNIIISCFVDHVIHSFIGSLSFYISVWLSHLAHWRGKCRQVWLLQRAGLSLRSAWLQRWDGRMAGKDPRGLIYITHVQIRGLCVTIYIYSNICSVCPFAHTIIKLP